MNKKVKVIPIFGIILLSSCGEKKLNYNQEYTSAYVYYKIQSETPGFQYIKEKELDLNLFNESKEFFIDLINANFENVYTYGDGAQGTNTYNLVLKYGKKSDELRISKDSLDPKISVYYLDDKGNNPYTSGGYMTYEYYKKMFQLIDEYEKLLSDVEWEKIEFNC